MKKMARKMAEKMPNGDAGFRGGFSAIELVFVIVIVGVLSAVAIPKFLVSRDDACALKLRSAISETETVLSRAYTKSFLKNVKIEDKEKENLIKTLESANGKGCSFQYLNNTAVRATVGKKTIDFEVRDDANSNMPTIYCDPANELCRKITGKEQTK